MGKLLITLIIVCCTQLSIAQDTLCVYKIKGNVTVTNAKKALRKGDFILQGSKLLVAPGAELMAIDDEGSLYTIKKEGHYRFNDVIASKIAVHDKSMSSKYFAFIWNELTHKSEHETVIAGVYRGETLMEQPALKAQISGKVKFQWKLDQTVSTYHIFLRNLKTGTLHEFESDGSSLTIYPDNPIFTDSSMFEWSVSTEAFPNLKNLPFYAFTYLNPVDYKKVKNNYDQFKEELKGMDINEIEIANVFCKRFDWCTAK